MNKEMEEVLCELLNFCALDPNRKIEVLEHVSAIQKISLTTCAGRLIEKCKDYCAYLVIQPDKDFGDAAEARLNELYALADLMLQSHDQELWSKESVGTTGVWTLVTRLATEAILELEWEISGRADPERLDLLICD